MLKIAVISQKGGVGKTTTALSIFHGARLRGLRVLGIDLDPQENFSLSLAGMNREGKNIADVIFHGVSIADAVVQYDDPDTPLLPAKVLKGSGDVYGADVVLAGDNEKATILRKALSSVENDFDVVVIDTPPSLGTITGNALASADFLVVPVSADAFGLFAIKQLAETVELFKATVNPSLKVAGVLIARYDARSSLSHDMLSAIEEYADMLGTTVFPVPIREAVACKEAIALQRSLEGHCPKGKVTADYRSFIDELFKRCSNG